MSEDEMESDDTLCLTFPFRRTPISHRYCVFDGHESDLVDVPRAARVQVNCQMTLKCPNASPIVQIFLKKNIYIAPGSRCCRFHLNAEQHFDLTAAVPNIASNAVDLTVAEITSLFSNIAAEFEQLEKKKGVKCSFDDFNDDEMKTYTSLNKEQFAKIVDIVRGSAEIKEAKASRATGVYLMKLRTGNSQDQIAKFVGIAQSSVSRYSDAVRKRLVEVYVPVHYGSERMTGEIIKANTTEIASALFGRDKLIVV